MNENIDVRIKEAVAYALVEERVKDHEVRISALEKFRWWLMGTIAIGALTSSGTLLLMLIKGGHA